MSDDIGDLINEMYEEKAEKGLEAAERAEKDAAEKREERESRPKENEAIFGTMKVPGGKVTGGFSSLPSYTTWTRTTGTTTNFTTGSGYFATSTPTWFVTYPNTYAPPIHTAAKPNPRSPKLLEHINRLREFANTYGLDFHDDPLKRCVIMEMPDGKRSSITYESIEDSSKPRNTLATVLQWIDDHFRL